MFQIGDKAKKERSSPQERYRPSFVLCHRQKINLPTQHKQPGVSGEVSFFMWTHTTSKQVVYYHTTSDRVSQERCCVSCDPCHNHIKQITNIPQVVSQERSGVRCAQHPPLTSFLHCKKCNLLPYPKQPGESGELSCFMRPILKANK